MQKTAEFDPTLSPLEGDNWGFIISWLNNEFGRSTTAASRIKTYSITNGNFEIIIKELMSGRHDSNLIINWLMRTNAWNFNGELIEYLLNGISSFRDSYVLNICCTILPWGAGNERAIRSIKKIIVEHNCVDDFIDYARMSSAQFYSDLSSEYKLGIII